ncbi:MAG: bifunctional metallophosphatase/5'-nucleotidase [Lachnospiraceae bacterium]|nr:bifunctional metallophosphatase/5'-nucleotidase [Lachnospiraceae bacterium]
MKIFAAALLCLLPAVCPAKDVEIKILQTSDIHGNLFPENFITMTPAKGGMSRIAKLVKDYRGKYGDNVILLDNGDILQGQPSVYYYNYVDTLSPHITAQVMNYMGYDAGNVGNHDVETGRRTLDRWVADCKMPILGANILDKNTGEPHFTPYKVFERDGVKIAVLGMITPAIPVWLSEDLWEGLTFVDMEESARKWIPIIKSKENPDIIVGLFHAGKSGTVLSGIKENPSMEIARNIPGFDLILFGHDHLVENKKIENIAGDSVLLMNPANTGQVITDVTIKVSLDEKGKVTDKSITGTLADVNKYQPDNEFMSTFSPQIATVREYVSEPVGFFTDSITSDDVLFGPSKLIDLIHEFQLESTGADISFAAPISTNASIKAGTIHMSDLFSLYKYENALYVMELTGKEIKDYLEFSYSLWTDRMKDENDHLLLFKEQQGAGEAMRAKLKNPPYNFDSAAGIKYVVDVTKPAGEKITIMSMADGAPFDMDKTYKVALSSYRGNGGGEHLTKGVGLDSKGIADRIIYRSKTDLRSIIADRIRKKGHITPRTLDTWKFIPEDMARKAAEKDARLLR